MGILRSVWGSLSGSEVCTIYIYVIGAWHGGLDHRHLNWRANDFDLLGEVKEGVVCGWRFCSW